MSERYKQVFLSVSYNEAEIDRQRETERDRERQRETERDRL